MSKPLVTKVGGQPVSAQTIRRTQHQIGLHGCHSRRKPLLKMMQKKAYKQFAEHKQIKDMDYWNHVLWSDKTKMIIAKIKSFISFKDLETVIHAFISSRLDYCNSLYLGVAQSCLSRLQLVQNSAARFLTNTRKRENITPVLVGLL